MLKEIKKILSESFRTKDKELIKNIQELEEKLNILSKKKKELEDQGIFKKTSLHSSLKERASSHPIKETIRKIYKIMENEFQFEWAEGPEVDSLDNIFEKLNMDHLHPAREDHQSFYIKDEVKTLRTHCTNFQSHILANWNEKEEIKKFHLGKVYRADSDSTHTPMFHQFEVLYLGKDANLPTLFGFIEEFFTKFFEKPIKTRVRTSYFPFTTPSYEVDIFLNDKWLEIGGCGIVHEKVFINNKKKIERGWAWGMGVERLTMVRDFRIKDIRNLYKNDIRFF